MTRKDYVRIAEAFRGTRPKYPNVFDTLSQYQTWLATRRAVAAELMKDNPRFDSGKFYDATEK